MAYQVLFIAQDTARVEELSDFLQDELPKVACKIYNEENEILKAIQKKNYDFVVIDIHIDKFSFSVLDLVNKINEVHPAMKLYLYATMNEQRRKLAYELVDNTSVTWVIDKDDIAETGELLLNEIAKIVFYKEKPVTDEDINKALNKEYVAAKSEKDPNKKGQMFETFIMNLFKTMGFGGIYNRVKDITLSEVDVVIRNEIYDPYLRQFGRYILIECKNSQEKVNKNDFIIFNSKLKLSLGMAEFGIITTSGDVTRSTYYEALKSAGERRKIIFLSHSELELLIFSKNKIETFKDIIDSQV